MKNKMDTKVFVIHLKGEDCEKVMNGDFVTVSKQFNFAFIQVSKDIRKYCGAFAFHTKQDADMFTQTMNEHFGTSFVSNGEVAYIESKYANF